MTREKHNDEMSTAEHLRDAGKAVGKIEKKILKREMEELVDPQVATRLGLKWAEAWYRYGSLSTRSFPSSLDPNNPKHSAMLERYLTDARETTDALHDARLGQLTFLKEHLVSEGIFMRRMGLPVGIRLIIIGLAMPNELLPQATDKSTSS